MFMLPLPTDTVATSESGIRRPLGVSEPDHDREAPLALPELRGRLAAEGGLDDVLDVGDVQSVTGRTGAIDLDPQLRDLAGAIHERTRDTGHRRDRLQDLVRKPAQHDGVVPERLDDDLSVDLRDALEHVVADGLREARLDAGNRLEGRVHLLDELLLANVRTPLLGRLHGDQKLRHVDHLGIGPVFRPSSL
jgi:hypothetical protein